MATQAPNSGWVPPPIRNQLYNSDGTMTRAWVDWFNTHAMTIQGTHAQRLNISAKANQNLYALYYESDRSVLYTSINGIWQYVAGMMIGQVPPVDLGLNDNGFLFLNTQFPGGGVNLLCDGDSLTAGYYTANHATDSYPSQLAVLLNTANLANEGVAGATSTNVLSHAIPAVMAGVSNFYLLWIGTNDLLLSTSLATLEGNVSTRIAAVVAAGYTPILFTLPHTAYTGSPTPPSNYDSQRLLYNTWLKANFLNVVDLAADPRLQTPTDTTIYSDGLHMTTLGYSYVAQDAENVLISNFSSSAMSYWNGYVWVPITGGRSTLIVPGAYATGLKLTGGGNNGSVNINSFGQITAITPAS